MTTREMDPVFASALREALIANVERTPRLRRRWRWRLGIGVCAGSVFVGGGVALAAGVFSPPGAPLDTQLGNIIVVTRTGSATIDIGPAPATATNVSLTLTCLSVGTFDFPDGSSMTCSPPCRPPLVPDKVRRSFRSNPANTRCPSTPARTRRGRFRPRT